MSFSTIDPTILYFAAALAALVVGGAAFRKWRQKQLEQGEADEAIWRIIERGLEKLREVVRDEARQIGHEEVRRVAGDLYRQLIAPTRLTLFISQEQFVTWMLEAWVSLVDVEVTVTKALSAGRQ